MADPCNYSSLLMSGVETRRCSEGSFLGGMVVSLARCGEKTFLVVSVRVDGDGHLFGIVHFLHLSMFRKVLNSLVLLTLIRGLASMCSLAWLVASPFWECYG